MVIDLNWLQGKIIQDPEEQIRLRALAPEKSASLSLINQISHELTVLKEKAELGQIDTKNFSAESAE